MLSFNLNGYPSYLVMNTAYPCFSLGYVPFLKTYSLLKLLNILTYKYLLSKLLATDCLIRLNCRSRDMKICDHMEDVFQAEYQLDGLRLESDYTKKTKSKEEKKE